MFIYIFSAIFGWLLWKLFWFYKNWSDHCLRYKGMPILSANHWFWGFTNKIDTLDGLIKQSIEDMDTTPEKREVIVTRMTCFVNTLWAVCPSAIRDIATASNLPKQHQITGAYRLIEPWIGNGLLTSGGPKWERNRRLLTPAFHFDILKPYVNIMNDVADLFMVKIKGQISGGKCIDIYPMVCSATLDTMLRCTVSYTDDTVQNTECSHPYVLANRRLMNLTTLRCVNPLMLVDWTYALTSEGREFKRLYTFIHEFSDKIINTRRKDLENDPSQLEKRHLDFLDILITARDEHGIGLTDLEIRDQVDTFVFEGHDTSAAAVSWAIHSMAKYPDMQTKIRDEVKDILSKEGRTHLTVDDLTQLKYTTCFIKETLRMYAPVPVTGRDVKEPITIAGRTFMPGDQVNIIPYLVHHNPDIWDNHMEFRPERFLPENSVERDPYAFVPFSAGQRNCIGQNFAMNEIKILIGTLVTRYLIKLDLERAAEPFFEIVTRPKDGMFLYFEDIS